MPRQARHIEPGVPLHVVQRGVDRQRCFRAESDFQRYWQVLQRQAKVAGCGVHAYVLMTNHIHLLLTPTAGFGEMMKAIGQQYAQYFNAHYRRTGPLWESRYRAHPILDEAHLLTCQRYIELNPVRAGMCNSPAAYRWSSYGGNAEGRADDVLTPHDIFLSIDANPVERQAYYRGLFDVPIAAQFMDAIRAATVTGHPLGIPVFVRGR